MKQIKIHDGASSDYSIEKIKYPQQSLLCYWSFLETTKKHNLMLCFKRKSKETRLLRAWERSGNPTPTNLLPWIRPLFNFPVERFEAKNENDKHQTLSEHPFFSPTHYEPSNFHTTRENFSSFLFLYFSEMRKIVKEKSIMPKGAIKLKEKLCCEN